MIFQLCFFVIAIASVKGQGPIPIREYRVDPYFNESPKPYAFSYNAPLEDGIGQSSRTESADGSGRVQGSYTINNDEGHYRVVEYIADQDGFRATIRTNEPGTDNQSPADVTIHSEAGPAPYISGVGRPLLNAPVLPVAPVVNPAVVPEAVVPVSPVRRPVYRRPALYNARNYAYRPANRYPY